MASALRSAGFRRTGAPRPNRSWGCPIRKWYGRRFRWDIPPAHHVVGSESRSAISCSRNATDPERAPSDPQPDQPGGPGHGADAGLLPSFRPNHIVLDPDLNQVGLMGPIDPKRSFTPTG